MIEGEPSQTALHVAAARAAHLRYDPEPHLLVDTPAAELLGERAEALMPSYADGGSFVLVENRLAIPLRARFAFRFCFPLPERFCLPLRAALPFLRASPFSA